MFHAKEYKKVESLQEAYELNQKKNNMVIGGMMWLRMEHVYKGTVIDLSGLGLNQIEETPEEFRIGCMCTLRQLELDERLQEYFHGVMQACTCHIVGTQFRNTATVGGSIFGRYGFSDILTAFLLFDTYVELYQGGVVSLAEFAQRKKDNDILVRIIIRKDGRDAAYLTQRNTSTDFPVIACGAARKNDSYVISIGARPNKAKAVELPIAAAGETAKAAVEQFEFFSNVRASGDYRRSLAEIYVRRLIETLEERRG